MKVELNHTIVHVKNKKEAAHFLADLFELPEPEPFYAFLMVRLEHGASLDFLETDEPFQVQHYAFLIGEKKFDKIYEKIQKRNIRHWADPGKSQPGKINTYFGGRGVYFEDPSGNLLLEIITKPYGNEGEE